MESFDTVSDALKKLKEFFTNIIDTIQQCQDPNEITKGIENEFSKLSSNGGDCSYYLSAITYLQGIADIINTPSVQNVLNSKNEITFEENQISNPVYRALLDTCIQIRTEYEEFKVKTQSAVPRLEALNVSLNTMLSDEQNARIELEEKLKKKIETHRKIVEDLRARVTTRDQQIHDLENKYDMLQSENAALAKSKGRNVDAVYQEMQKIKIDNEMKTEKIRMIEEQNRQNLLIYANEISQLKDAGPLPQAVAAEQNKVEEKKECESLESMYAKLFEEIDKHALEASVIETVNTNIMKSLEKRREFAIEMIKSFGVDASGANIIEDLKEQLNKLDDDLKESKCNFETQKEEIKRLTSQVEENNVSFTEKKKEFEEEIFALSKDKEEKELLLERLKTDVSDLSSKSNDIKEKINEIEAETVKINAQVLDEESILDNNKREQESKTNELNQKTKELEDLKKSNEDTVNSIKECNENIIKNTEEIEKQQEEQKKLEEELAGLSQRLETLTKSKEDNENTLQRLRSSVEKQNTETETTLNDVYKLETRVAQVNENLQGRIQTIRDVAFSMEMVCKEHKELIGKLSALSDSLKENLNDKTPFQEVQVGDSE